MTEPHALATPDVVPAAPDSASRWEDFVDIFHAPAQVFARRAHAGFGIPMLVVTVVGAAIFFATYNATAPAFDADIARSMAAAAKQGATAEQLSAGSGVATVFVKVMAVIGPPIAIFMTGLLLWLAGKVVGAKQTLNAAILVAAFANVPRLLGALLGGVVALLADASTLTSRHALGFGPARFMDADASSPVLLVLASRLDLFTLWATLLLAIGLAVTGKVSRQQGAIAAALVWLVGMLPELSGALRQ
jgi:hypothetical protein